MQSKENTQLIIVRLLEPSLCLSCRFRTEVTVEMQDSGTCSMLHCKRHDCDNWQIEEVAEVPKNIVHEI